MSVSSSDSATRQVSLIQPPKQSDEPVANGMPPPPMSKPFSQRNVPSPPPKFRESQPSAPNSKSHGSAPREKKVNTSSGPLLQLMEYGDEDDDSVDEDDGCFSGGKIESARVATAKPFWAV